MGLYHNIKRAYNERNYLPSLWEDDTEDAFRSIDRKNIPPSITGVLSKIPFGFSTKRATQPIKVGGEDSLEERWFYVNGICTTKDDLKRDATILNNLLGASIYALYNPTEGVAVDIARCIAEKDFDVNEPIMRNLAHYVEEALHKKCNVKVITHSSGGIIVNNMVKYFLLKGLPMKKLEIFSFGSACDLIMNVNGLSQEHYANEHDYIARIGIMAFQNQSKNLIIRGGAKGHDFGAYMKSFVNGNFDNSETGLLISRIKNKGVK